MSSTPLPPLYASWITECLGGEVPAERRATCNDCAMLPAPDRRAAGGFFEASTKCCTYMPQLPNYLVGAALDDLDPSPVAVTGRRALARRIAERVATTPLGLYRRPRDIAAYDKHVDFGREPTFVCPYLVAEAGGMCGIWQHRGSVCSTWFCKHERGALGKRFWVALRDLLLVIERSLARYCVLELAPGAEALQTLFPLTTEGQPATSGNLEGIVPEREYRAIWGTWVDREVEFYVAASHLVRSLAWDEVAEIGGSELSAQESILVPSYRALIEPRNEGPLRIGPLSVISLDRQAVRVMTYSVHDPLELPFDLFAALARFDGRPTATVTAEIRAEECIEIDPSLVEQLRDHQILIDDERR